MSMAEKTGKRSEYPKVEQADEAEDRAAVLQSSRFNLVLFWCGRCGCAHQEDPCASVFAEARHRLPRPNHEAKDAV